MGYFHRGYSTSQDGTVTEHDDGFSRATVKVVDGLDILVGPSPSIMSGNFTIGWSKWKFAYEPHDPL